MPPRRRRRRSRTSPTTGEVVASFDPDAIFDYRSRRPVLDVMDGRLCDLRWPELTLRHVAVGGRDLLILSGAEPDLRWQELADDMVELAGGCRSPSGSASAPCPARSPTRCRCR